MVSHSFSSKICDLSLVSWPVSHVCVRSCVRACVSYLLHKCMLPGRYNSETNHRFGFEHCEVNGSSALLLLLDLDFRFQGQILSIILVLRISCKRQDIEQTLLLLSNRKSCICHRTASLRMVYIMSFYLRFQGHELLLRISRYINSSCHALSTVGKFLLVFNLVCGGL